LQKPVCNTTSPACDKHAPLLDFSQVIHCFASVQACTREIHYHVSFLGRCLGNHMRQVTNASSHVISSQPPCNCVHGRELLKQLSTTAVQYNITRALCSHSRWLHPSKIDLICLCKDKQTAPVQQLACIAHSLPPRWMWVAYNQLEAIQCDTGYNTSWYITKMWVCLCCIT
jgi:hypothetical protein